MKNTKAQAALEFLLTYGWAILGVMVVLGTLAYFGIFNTKQYTQDICNFGDQWKCEDYILHEDGWIAFKLRNNFGVEIEVSKVIISSDYGNAVCLGGTVAPGNLIEIYQNCDIGTLVLYDKSKINAAVEFKKTGSTNIHNQTGTILGTVQPSGTCINLVKDCHETGCESDLDCGGPCDGCSDGWMCNVPSDCEGRYCCYGICDSDTCGGAPK